MPRNLTRLGYAGLLLAGSLAGLLLLEAALRTAGFAVKAAQAHRNRAALARGGFRVLCLGESTTQGQFPPFLDEALNAGGAGRFTVIDEGRGGTNTDAILARTGELLDRYRPDIVVAMMGINDLGSTQVPREEPAAGRVPALLGHLKTYKLARILARLYAGERWAVKPPPAAPPPPRAAPAVPREFPDTPEVMALRGSLARAPRNPALLKDLGWALLRLRRWRHAEEAFSGALEGAPAAAAAQAGLGWALLEQGRHARAEDLFRSALKADPREARALAGLGWLLFDTGKFDLAGEPFRKAAAIDPSNAMAQAGLGRMLMNANRLREAEAPLGKALALDPRNLRARAGLAWACLELGRAAEAQRHFSALLDLEPADDMARMGLGRTYMKLGDFSRAEEEFRRVLLLNPGNERAYFGLDLLYQYRGGAVPGREEYLEAARRHAEGFKTVTAANYRALKALLDKRGIRLVCVQYPMRSAAPLRTIFEGEDGVIFVDNEAPFREAVAAEGYQAYFRDMFGGNFGHCTDKGNRLLGRRIAQAILREVFGR